MTSVQQCASTLGGEQCDQISGHYPTTSHHVIRTLDDVGNTETLYWADEDADGATPGG